MSARRTDMHRLQEMVRLHRMGQSGRAIARQLRLGRNTVACYLGVFARTGMLEGPEGNLPEADVLRRAVEEHLPAGKPPGQRSSVESWRDEIERLRKKGAGPTAIHDWLRVNKSDYTGSVSAVKRMYRGLELTAGPKATDVAIPVETLPGEVAQVDFGYAGKRYDPKRGVLRKCWIFVMTLCFSRRVFCDLVFDQKIETWVELHIQAFEYFGGVPRVMVPDNLKAAVIRAAFGVDDELMLNRTYRELARHYGFQIDPTPVRSPEKKGKVERDVQYVKGNFLATWDSVDIDADRLALRRWVVEIADKRRHGTTGRVPAELFEEDERDALLPLPEKCWEKIVWKKARLHRDSHVQIDASFYSAPWRYLHRDLWVRCTPFVVAIHFEDEHLWTHSRVPRGKRSTVEGHLPEHRRDLRHRSREYWVSRAQTLGQDVACLVETIFAADDVLLQLRKVQQVVTLLEKYPRARACATARRTLYFRCLEYRSIKNILTQALDLEPLAEEPERDWSNGSRFARKPTDFLFPQKETLHADH